MAQGTNGTPRTGGLKSDSSAEKPTEQAAIPGMRPPGGNSLFFPSDKETADQAPPGAHY